MLEPIDHVPHRPPPPSLKLIPPFCDMKVSLMQKRSSQPTCRFALLLAVSCGLPSLAFAQETDGKYSFSIAQAETQVFQLIGGSMVPVSSVASKTMLAVHNGDSNGGRDETDSVEWKEVRLIDPRIKLTGWVRAEQLHPVVETTSKVQEGSTERIPRVIALASPGVKTAWLEVQSAIAENANLPRPLPDPYFARAEIWAAANSNEEALRDFVTAFRLSLEFGEDLQSYSRHFSTLAQVLDSYDKVPRPPVPGLASSHYGRGINAYFDGDLASALSHFNDAVQLDPNEPVFRYFRAITYKRLGDDSRARHDALFGADLEERFTYKLSLGSGFTRVQGDLRRWLEGFRNGGPSQMALIR